MHLFIYSFIISDDILNKTETDDPSYCVSTIAKS